MKKTITLFALAAICATANAKVLTVSNNANSPGQYTDLQVAITAAANNDTLYVHGSPISYGEVYISKPLTIIGAGALPDKTPSIPTTFNNMSLQYNGTYSTSGSGSKIFGCTIGGLGFSAGNGSTTAGISNVIIARNRISTISFGQIGTNAALAHNNISIFNNIIGNISGNGSAIKNTVIKNNIINGTIGYIGQEAVGSWILTNNLILANITSIRSAVISNNIIFIARPNSALSYNEYCSVSNNCFYNSQYTYVISSIIYGTNTGGNNLLNQDPLFVYYDAVHGYTLSNPATGPFANFNLQTGSPCLLAGSDGLDLGIYGGNTPFVEGYPADSRFRYFPMPSIPQMLEMNIQNAAILPSGTLNVNFKARKQN